jgi:hypothetical protein
LVATVDLLKILPTNLHELWNAMLERQSACKYVILMKQRKPSSAKRKVT